MVRKAVLPRLPASEEERLPELLAGKVNEEDVRLIAAPGLPCSCDMMGKQILDNANESGPLIQDSRLASTAETVEITTVNEETI